MERTRSCKNFINGIAAKFFLTEDYLLFSGIIIFVVSLISGVLYYTIYHSYTKNIEKSLEITSARIDILLADIFNETNRLMVYIGKQIAQNSPDNFSFISDLFKNTSGSEYKARNILSWTLFDWVDRNNLQMVNRTTGISPNPPNMSQRAYTWKSRKFPWTLQISPPAIGNPSGVWVIPAGTGIMDDKGNFLGTIVVGFNIAELTTILEKKLPGENASFIVLDEECNVILASSDNRLINPNNDSPYRNSLALNGNKFLNFEGSLQMPIKQNGITYSFYKKMEKYPYIILTGLDNNLYAKQFYVLVFPRIIEVFVMGVFSLLLLHIFRKRIIKLSKISDKAKEEFISLTGKRLQGHIRDILQYSNILVRFSKGEIKVGINEQRQREFISHIYESALNLKDLTTNTLELSMVDINAAIKDCVSIQKKIALQRDITIKMELEPFVPFLEADEFCIKQIIVGLLSFSINYTPPGGNIWISTFSTNVKNQQAVSFKIHDNGFSLGESDMIRMAEKFETNGIGKKQDGTDLTFESIAKLIKLHNGTYKVVNIEGKGKTITVIFPPNILRLGYEKIQSI